MFSCLKNNVKKWRTLLSTTLAICIIGIAGGLHAAENTSTISAKISTAGVMSQEPHIYSINVGGAKITSISDGTIPLNIPKLMHGNAAFMKKQLKNSFLSEDVETSIYLFLIEKDGRKILVDTGAGELLRKVNIGGKLFDGLKAAGISPSDITDILITHIHLDHSGGLTIAGKRMFPNAVVHIGKPDVDFFLNPDIAKTSTYRPAALPTAFEEAVQTVKPYVDSGQVRTFDKTTEILPGITATLHPGHTPGSAFYTLVSNEQTIVFMADTVHVAELQFANPKITIEFDYNRKQAAASRAKAFADFSRSGVLVAGAHLPYPGIGHIQATGKSYRFVSVPFNDR